MRSGDAKTVDDASEAAELMTTQAATRKLQSKPSGEEGAQTYITGPPEMLQAHVDQAILREGVKAQHRAEGGEVCTEAARTPAVEGQSSCQRR